MSYQGDNLMSVKRTNRSAALRILHEQGSMSRKRLAENMHLTPAAITKIVGEMIGEGLLSEGEMISCGNAGRREVLIDINNEYACGLGVLILLGSATLSAVWLDGSVIFSETVDLPEHAPAEETVRALSARLMELVRENGISRERISGLGIAVRGITSEDGRTVRNSFGALAETDYPLCEAFEAETGIHTTMENNVRSLLAAQMFLAKDGVSSGAQFFVRCDTGIGAALSIDGEIWHGVTAQCAEIGHIPVVRRGGKPCHCGKSGCLETIASPGAILEDARESLSPDETPLLWRRFGGDSGKMTVHDVFQAASNGDSGASVIVDRAVKTLGMGIKTVIYLVDPGKIVFYGDMFEDPYYLSLLNSELQEGVDTRHSTVFERSRYNKILDERAACLLAVEEFMDRGGILPL